MDTHSCTPSDRVEFCPGLRGGSLNLHSGERKIIPLKQDQKERVGRISFLLLVVYGIVVIYFVLFSDRLGRADGYDTYRFNLTLFDEIRRFILYRDFVSTGALLLNLLGNLMVLFPVGFLVPIWRQKKTGLIRILLCSFVLSLGIETLQLITKVGVFDVDDLFLNTLGGGLGYITYRVLEHLILRRKESRSGQEEQI